jgi:Tol biopolymer transport system component
MVMFIDKPAENAPTGFYAVDVTAPAPPKLISEHVAFFSSDMQFAISYDAVNATIERFSDGQKWQIRNGGRTVLLSPNHKYVVWNESGQNGPIETRVTTVMMANLDGTDGHPLGSALRAGVSAWLGDDRLLMTARPNRSSQEVTLSVYSLSGGASRVLATSEHLRNVLPSPDGTWVAYTIVFDKDLEQNGLWLIRADAGTARKLDFWGSVQWRDNLRIVYVPLLSNSTNHAFYEYDAETGVHRRLTDPSVTSFKIANGDWVVSPDGSKIVFLETKDLNLWMWSLND